MLTCSNFVLTCSELVLTCSTLVLTSSYLVLTNFDPSTNSHQALAFSRFLKIVCMCKFGLRLTAIFSAIFASPLVGLPDFILRQWCWQAVAVVLIHFDGFLYPRNDVCMPILFLKAAHLPVSTHHIHIYEMRDTFWHGLGRNANNMFSQPYYAYTFAVPSLAVALNLITVMHLIRYRTQKSNNLTSG